MVENSNIRIKHIDITPHKSLMPKIGQAGYSVSQAISELIDNSLDARFEDETLNVYIKIKKDFIEVTDDGKGMDESIAEKALKLAYSEKKNQLGEFGLGLKTACQSLGKRFIITTTQRDNDEEYILDFDEDEWMEKGDWTNHIMKIKKTTLDSSGTTVRVDKLKIKFYANLVTNIKEELSLRFAPYINNGEIIIKVNEMACKPQEIELTEESKEDFEFKLQNGIKISGWRGLMKNPGGAGNKGYYGFNTYRRGRLITQYDKIGFNPHPEVRRIVGELFMDNIPVTHNKREWIKESYEYILMEEKMRDYMKPFLAKARSYESVTKVDSALKEKMDIQEEIIARAIKETPELKSYAAPNMPSTKPEDKAKKDSETSNIELIEIEQRDRQDVPAINENKEPEEMRERKPKKTHLKKKYILTINGKKFRFTHEFKDLEDENLLKQVCVSEEKGIEIFTNTSFPAFMATRDQLFYATFNIAEGLADVMVSQKGETKENVNNLRDKILQKTGNIMRQIEEERKLLKEKEIIEKKLIQRKANLEDSEND